MSKKTSNPKISVVIPIYNCDRFLEEALASLLIQTYENFEIIAVNDGSKDGSLKILEKFATHEPRLRIINQKNGGIVNALNNGIKEARGEYIARMDGDDICFPNRFADQIAVLDASPNTVLVAGDFEVINEESEFLYRELVFPESQELKNALYLRNPIAHGSTMYRKSIFDTIGGYRNLHGPTEDLDLWMRLAKEGDFQGTATSVYKWRMNQSGLTLTNNAASIEQAKGHFSRRWEELLPDYQSRQIILTKAAHYLKQYKKNGVHYRYHYLSDTAHLGAKLIARGHKVEGIKQMLTVASTGRTGVRIVWFRVRAIMKGRLNG